MLLARTLVGWPRRVLTLSDTPWSRVAPPSATPASTSGRLAAAAPRAAAGSRASSQAAGGARRPARRSAPSLLDQALLPGSAVQGPGLDDGGTRADMGPRPPSAPARRGEPSTVAAEAGASPASPSRYRAGTLQALPIVAGAAEHLKGALRRAGRVTPTPGLKTAAAKARNLAAKQLDALTKELAGPLGQYVRGFPPPARLHPFEAALVDLTVGPGRYERALTRVDSLRRGLLSAGKAAAGRAAGAASQRLAEQEQAAGIASLQALFSGGSEALDELVAIAKQLRALPVAEPAVPTLVLVGAPNVGKSSLVRALSSGVPEVCDYPFTTRGIIMGHFWVDSRRHVVTDTPGLLARPDGSRNRMERLTLISLAHLPAAVLFVCDLSGRCGTPLEEQLLVREELRARFPGRPWLDVMSKSDLWGDVRPPPVLSGRALPVSISDAASMARLTQAVVELLDRPLPLADGDVPSMPPVVTA